MDVFKLDLDQAQIGSSLVENNSNNNTIQRNLHTTTGSAGSGININKRHGVDDDEDEVLPEVSFDANSDFNLHFFDTPEDSSTQGGFSDPGSVESETEPYIESSLLSATVHHSTNAITSPQHSSSLATDCQKFYQSSTAAALNQRNLTQSSTSLPTNNSISPAANSTNFPQFGNGGGSLYATNNIHNFTQSNSSSSGCSSTSSIASNSSSICGSSSSINNNNNSSTHSNSNNNPNNGSIAGNNRIVGSATISSSSAAAATTAAAATSLGTEHFIGNLNHTTQSSTVSSSIASLANVKLPTGRIYNMGI